MAVFDHLGLSVSDYAQSKAFYEKVLAPLGITVMTEGEGWCLIGRMGEGYLWLGRYGTLTAPIHIAFSAKTRADVRAFYEAALAAGAKDNGKPGIRTQYHPNYYGAFVLDRDGHNIEAVCHTPE